MSENLKRLIGFHSFLFTFTDGYHLDNAEVGLLLLRLIFTISNNSTKSFKSQNYSIFCNEHFALKFILRHARQDHLRFLHSVLASL